MIEEKLIQRTAGLEKKEPVFRDFRAGDVRHSQANIDKAQALLNYQPKYMISDGMDEAMDWYLLAEELQLSDKDKTHPSLANAKDLFE